MSHSVKVTLIADQIITFQGAEINVHNIESIILNANGEIAEIVVRLKRDGWGCDMNEQEWRGYYSQMILRGGPRAEKVAEMVANCGGQKRTLVKDPADPLKAVEVVEPFEEAVWRIKGEILEMNSRQGLERKANQVIAELRRR